MSTLIRTRRDIPKAPYYILGWKADPGSIYRQNRYILPALSKEQADTYLAAMTATLDAKQGTTCIFLETAKPVLAKAFFYTLVTDPTLALEPVV